MHSKHSKKEVNEVLDYADMLGHKVEQTVAGHKWGRITCSLGHRVSVWSTLAIRVTTRGICGSGLTSMCMPTATTDAFTAVELAVNVRRADW